MFVVNRGASSIKVLSLHVGHTHSPVKEALQI
jgi:hypothetical protein